LPFECNLQRYKAVYGAPTKGLKKIVPDVIEEAMTLSAKEPEGVSGETAVSFGAGTVFDGTAESELLSFDKVQMDKTEVPVSR
jgi:15-cis-phytoene desaturase